VWNECIDGKQTRTCKNAGTCEEEEDKPIEIRECALPKIPVPETTSEVGVGAAVSLFDRLKETWWVIFIAAIVLGTLGWFGFSKYNVKRKINQKLKDKKAIEV